MAKARKRHCSLPWFVHLFRTSEAIYKVTPFSPECMLLTLSLALPRLDFSHGKIHWRLWQGLHRFHTSWPCYTPASETKIINLVFSITSNLKGKKDIKFRAIWTKLQMGYDPVQASSSTSHPSSVTATPRTLRLRTLWQYKKSDFYTACINRIDLLSCPCLISRGINHLLQGVNPIARKPSYATTPHTPRQVIHCWDGILFHPTI